MPSATQPLADAMALLRQAHWSEAEQLLREVVRLDRADANGLNLLAIALQQQRKTAEAVVHAAEACAAAPTSAEFRSNLAAMQLLLGQYEAAEASARAAIELDPQRADAVANLGNAQRRLGRLEEAISSFRTASVLRPDIASYRNNLGDLLLRLGRIDEAIPELRAVAAAHPENLKARSDLIMTLNYSSAIGGAELLAEAERFGQLATAGAARHRLDPQPRRADGQGLRIGFVSGDLRHHAVAQFLEGALRGLAAHGHALHAYPTRDAADKVSQRMRPQFAGWQPLTGLGDREAAAAIADDEIHILIDLSGHTGSNRLPLFAHRPAPVAATWIGYSGTTGLAEMDYLLADRFVVPPEHERFYRERVWRLPDCYLLFDPPARAPAVPALPAIRNGAITFGSFNNLAKLADATLDSWAELLVALPEARIVLKSPTLSADQADQLLAAKFSARGVAMERITVLGRIGDPSQHLAAYGLIDIALDPFPYAGTTTTFEALWMGRPVLSLRGDRFTARVGDSILSNLDLSDWVAANQADYVKLGV